eukprot:1787481-Pleurochrysis_carterae.AAC.1
MTQRSSTARSEAEVTAAATTSAQHDSSSVGVSEPVASWAVSPFRDAQVYLAHFAYARLNAL